MTFWEAFYRALRWRPRQALGALYWHLTRRRVRARNWLRVGAAEAPYAYDYWVESVEDHPALQERVPVIVHGWHYRPKFTVLLHATGDTSPSQIQRSIESVKNQFYRQWELILPPVARGSLPPGDLGGGVTILPVSDAPPFEAGVSAATGDFVVPLRAGDRLSLSALFRFAEILQKGPKPLLIYGDQDELNPRGRRFRPWFKPQWDAEMFLAQDYLSEACALDASLANDVLPLPESARETEVVSFLLAVSQAAAERIVHIPHVLCHVDVRMRPSLAARVETVARHVKPLNASAIPGPFDTVKVVWPLPADRPGVSIIIPTRDKVELLRACIDSVVASTRYPEFEIIVVDNASTEPETVQYLANIQRRPNIRVISYDHAYNYSAINNFAAGFASYPYLCLLNNDTEVIAGDWLTEMMRYAVRPHVGAVGAMLLYDDGSIQHAGVLIGTCEAAGHAHRFERSDEAGYFAQPHIAHVVSAVTAACLVVDRRKYEAVGGLDAENLAVAYNDVDLCLKLEKAGWRNLYVPHAVLLHHESKSRGQDISPKNIERYMSELGVLQDRWGTKTYVDPRHNKNLDRYSENFILRF